MMRSRSHTIYWLVGGLVLLLIALIGVTAQTTHTFSSRASEEPETITISSLSLDILELSAEKRPACVQSFSYLPSTSNTQTTCFAQFRCADDAKSSLDMIQNHRCTAHDTLISCDVSGECVSVDQWAKRAGEICGC